VSFCAPPLVDGPGELAPIAASGSRSGVCAASHRYAEGRLLAENGCRRIAVRPLFWFAGVHGGLNEVLMTLLNRSQQTPRLRCVCELHKWRWAARVER
jgi:hypothetical protein